MTDIEVPEQWTGRINRTAEEIIAKADDWEHLDWLGTRRGDLFACLSFEDAKPFLVEGSTEESWGAVLTDRAQLWRESEQYLDFAWGKIQDERGISASRSVDHFIAWSWLLDETGQATQDLEALEYDNYGVEIVAKFAEIFGMRWPR